MEQVTTLTFLRYKGFKNKLWAFGMMQFAHRYLVKQNGLTFYKLLGSGRRNFNPAPDWSVYALLQVWDSEEAAENFFEAASLMKRYQKHSTEQWIIYLKNTSSKGAWNGANPFHKSTKTDNNNSYIAVITRASIRPKLLWRFWRYVPISQRSLAGNKGLIYTKGIGEAPIVQMATFSVWKDQESLMQFAYKSKEHQTAIKKTKKLDWYREELFSRFQPYRSVGIWEGTNPLPPLDF